VDGKMDQSLTNHRYEACGPVLMSGHGQRLGMIMQYRQRHSCIFSSHCLVTALSFLGLRAI
jgi:hypothetical protein